LSAPWWAAGAGGASLLVAILLVWLWPASANVAWVWLPPVLGLAAISGGFGLWQAAQRIERERADGRERQAALEAKIAELEEDLHLYERATRCAKVGFYSWDLREDRVLSCSPVFAALHGCTVGGYMARSPALMNDADLVHPDDRDYYIQACAASVEVGQPVILQYRIKTAEGDVRHLRMEEYRLDVEDGVGVYSEGIVQDITDLRRMETLLLHAVNSSSIMFTIFDPDDRLVLANPRFQTIHEDKSVPMVAGMSHENILRETVRRGAIKGTDRDVQAWLAKRLNRRRDPARSMQFQISTGRWIEITDLVMDDGHIFSLGIDITERRKMEAMLTEAQRREAAGRLAAGMAHDFNNLLGVIRGNVELMPRRDDGEQELIEAILRATDRAAELTDRLLAFTRQQPLRPRTVELCNLMMELVAQFGRILGKEIKIALHPPERPVHAKVDPAQLENALLNIVLNAGKAMPDGGVLTIACDRARPQAKATTAVSTDRHYARLSIADTGRGMAPEVLERALEPFFTTDHLAGSSGLGLSMVYGFAEQSGGLVELDSEAGRGTEVRLYLPLAEEGEEATGADDAVCEGGKGVVLVLDGSADFRAMVCAHLDRLGYSALQADSPAEADRLLRERQVAAALIDTTSSGGVRGTDLAAAFRRRHPLLRVVCLSNHSAETPVLGPGTVLLVKPFTRADLSEALEKTLR